MRHRTLLKFRVRRQPPVPTIESEMNAWIAQGLALLENYANRGLIR